MGACAKSFAPVSQGCSSITNFYHGIPMQLRQRIFCGILMAGFVQQTTVCCSGTTGLFLGSQQDTSSAETTPAPVTDNLDAQDATGPTSLSEKGPLQEIKQALDDYLDAGSEDGKLIFETKKTYQSVQPVADAIRSHSGNNGGTSSRSGGTKFSFNFSGDSLEGRIERDNKEDVHLSTIYIKETIEPHRTLTISNTDRGRVELTIDSTQSGYLLRLRQSEDGQFLIQEMDQENLFSSVADNFATFCLENPDFYSQRLSPTLEHFGINQLPSPYGEDFQKTFIKIISPWNATELAHIRDLTNSLDADNYKEREAASQQIKSEIGDIGVMLRLINDRQFRPETRARVRKLIYESLNKDQKNEVAIYENLLSNITAAYLVNLINLQTDPNNRQVLMERLRTLDPEWNTNKFSDEELLASLDKKNSSTASDKPNFPASVNDAEVILQADGFFGKIKEATGQIIRLTPHKSSLKIDREHWKTPFNGRPIEELSAEIQQLLKKNNLPNTWYQPGGKYLISNASHPQVLFEQLEAVCGNDRNYSHRRNHTDINRTFDRPKLNGKLIFTQPTPPRVRRGDRQKASDFSKLPVTIDLTEKEGPQRRILVQEPKPGELRLLVIGENPNHVVQLVLKQEKAWLQDIRGPHTRFFEAANFEEMRTKQPVYFKEYFFPLLRHLGVQIDPELVESGAGN